MIKHLFGKIIKKKECLYKIVDKYIVMYYTVNELEEKKTVVRKMN